MCNNLISLSLQTLVPEACLIGAKAGVSVEKLHAAISSGTGQNRAIERWPDTVFRGEFGAGFAIDLAAKDIDLALELADELGVPVEIGAAARAYYADAQTLGWGPDSMLQVVRALEQRAGVELRASDRTAE